MKIRTIALSLTLGAATCSAQAQESMPGMTMGPPQQQQQPPARGPNRTKQSPDPAAGDLKGMTNDRHDAKGKAAGASEGRSIEQQAGQGQGKPGAASDADSLTVPIQDTQEPEALGFHTGADLPAPELLRAVVSRQPMTVESFLALADADNPTLAQAQRNVDRARQQARQAGLPPDPVVGYSGDHIRGGSYHGGEEGAFFSQEFVLGRKLALRRDIYRDQGRANEFGVAIQRARVHDDVARAFFEALTDQESVVVHDRLLKVALDAETNAHELMRVGQADASDILAAEIAAEQAEVDFERSQRMFLSAFSQLATLAGQAAMDPHPLTGSLVEPPQLDAEEQVATDTQESPAVGQAQANVAVAEARLRSAKREKIPNLNVKAGEWYSGEDLGDTNRATGFMSFAEAGVQLPLWNRNQGNVGAAQAELTRAHGDVLRTQLLTRNRAEPYAQQYQIARSTAERYRTEMLPRARRAYQLEVLKYQQMAQAYPHVLDAQRMLFTLQLSYLHALDEEWQAALALQNYTLTNALDEPISTGSDDTEMNLPTASGSSH